MRRAGPTPTRPRVAAVLGAASLFCLLGAAEGGAQQDTASRAADSAGAARPAPPARAEGAGAAAGPGVLEEPEMARAPDAFRVALTGGHLSWTDVGGRPDFSGTGLWGVDVESRVNPFLAFRLSGAYGRSTATAGPGVGRGPETDTISRTEAAQYVFDLAGVLRLGIPSLRDAGAVPFGLLGLGTVVHDPVADALGTRSQSAWTFGAGIELDGLLPGPLGSRAEWRRYRVDGENLFDPTDRTGIARTADRFQITLYVAL